MSRFIAFGLAILLICGIAGAAPSRESARAQDADDDWPEIPTFQVPGTFQVSGTVDDAGDIAEVPGAIRVVSGGDGQATLATDVGVDLILDNSGSMLQTLGDERRIDIAKLVLTNLSKRRSHQVSRWRCGSSVMNRIPARQIWLSIWRRWNGMWRSIASPQSNRSTA